MMVIRGGKAVRAMTNGRKSKNYDPVLTDQFKAYSEVLVEHNRRIEEGLTEVRRRAEYVYNTVIIPAHNDRVKRLEKLRQNASGLKIQLPENTQS